ncbi:MAG: hypothetical protein GYA56_05510 [Geobacteraceae bacterium]|nr:hypothetical protein [Geobacteraceae bacterium]
MAGTFPSRALLFFAVLLLVAAHPLRAAASGAETRYDVTSRGMTVGSVTAVQKSAGGEGGAKRIHYENRTDVSASFLWIGYHSSTTERAEILGDSLVGYARTGEENGVQVQVEGRLAGDTFRFTVVKNGERKTLSFPRSSYDHTTMECPEATMSFGPDGRASLRVLDTEYLQVVTRNYRLVGEETCRIGRNEYRCRVVDFRDPHKSSRRWIGRDGDAVILFRQDGKSRSGSYSVRAREVNRLL